MRTLLLAFLISSANADQVTVMSWNIHHGQGLDGKTDLARIAKVISAAKTDVVFLQEVDKHCARSGNTDQAAELARLTTMHTVFGRALDIGRGQYGLAILSKTPLENPTVHPLSGPGEPRIALHAATIIGGRTLHLVNTHLEAGSLPARIRQAAAIDSLFRTRLPLILGGDFNDTPGSEALATFTPPWIPMAKSPPVSTAPADKPGQEIDFIFTLACFAISPAVVIPESIASDHRPVLARIRMQ